ncbi:MAG: 6-bladed beta-propeller [Bacteroidales bacterium]|nr:6-bladed beta-propeller [Bacteroidales bacterium]
MYKFLIVILFFASICSCDTKDSYEIIKVNFNSIENNNISITVDKLIPLETSDSSFVGTITKLRYLNGKFFVFDIIHKRTVTCFNSKGDFMFSIPFGKGPGELIMADDFDVFDRTLYIKSHHEIHQYNLEDGMYKKSLQYTEHFNKFSFLDSKHLITFGYSPSINDLKKYSHDIKMLENNISLYKIIDLNEKMESMTFLNGKFHFSTFLPADPVSKYGDNILCLYPPYNKIYNYNGQNMELKYMVDFGSFSFRNDELNSDIYNCINLIREGERAGLIDYIIETRDFITFGFLKQIGHNSYNIYSKSSHNSALLEDIVSENFLTRMSILSAFENKLLCILDPSVLDDFQINELNEKYHLNPLITNSSNPIIVIAKIYEKK